MSKHQILTQDEFNTYKVNSNLKRLIDKYQKENNLPNKDIRILDFGCGRGRSTLKLKLDGYDAYGVDTDPEPIQNGIPLFSEFGYEGKKILSKIDLDCETEFPDTYFDIIFSEQVVEHVHNIEAFFNEIARLTKPGGVNFHAFPFKYHFKEQHLYMPIIHWLPKNSVRYYAILFWTTLGKEPFWPELKSNNNKKKAHIYYNYSIEKTYYRSAAYFKRKSQSLGYKLNIRNLRYPLKIRRINTFFPHSTELIMTKVKSV